MSNMPWSVQYFYVSVYSYINKLIYQGAASGACLRKKKGIHIIESFQMVVSHVSLQIVFS